MERLGEQDLRRVLAAVEILGGDIGYASFPQRAMNAIAAVADTDLVTYNEVDLAGGNHRFLLRPDPADLGPGTPAYAGFVRRFGGHPLVARSVAASGKADQSLRLFVDRLRLLGMVGNCCGQGELRLNIGMSVEQAPTRRVGIAVYRSIRDFDDIDGARIAALQPHVQAALRVAVHTEAQNARPAPPTPAAPQATTAARLTPREGEVLYWVSMGKTNEEVAEIIGAKPMTIKKHLEHIYDKLGVPNRTAAARYSSGQPAPSFS